MTDRPHLEAGRDRLEHDWRCRRGPVVETVRRDSTGQALVVRECQGCGADDVNAATEGN